VFSAQLLENLKLVLDYGCIAISTSGQSSACPLKAQEMRAAFLWSQLPERPCLLSQLGGQGRKAPMVIFRHRIFLAILPLFHHVPEQGSSTGFDRVVCSEKKR
jgi:hypothetical protein